MLWLTRMRTTHPRQVRWFCAESSLRFGRTIFKGDFANTYCQVSHPVTGFPRDVCHTCTAEILQNFACATLIHSPFIHLYLHLQLHLHIRLRQTCGSRTFASHTRRSRWRTRQLSLVIEAKKSQMKRSKHMPSPHSPKNFLQECRLSEIRSLAAIRTAGLAYLVPGIAIRSCGDQHLLCRAF